MFRVSPSPVSSPWISQIWCRPMTLRTRFMGNRSWPAATGVCVVKTHLPRTLSMCSGLIFRPPDAAELLIEQLQDQEGGVPFVHVEAVDLVVSERAQDSHAADAQHVLLAEPVALVAAIEMVAQLAVLLVIGGQVGIEEQHRHGEAGHAHDVVLPGTHLDFSLLDDHRDLRLELLQVLRNVPHVGLFDLRAGRIQFLMKISFAGQHRHGHHRHFHVGGGLNRITRQDAQSAAVRRHVGPQDRFPWRSRQSTAGKPVS